MEGTGGGPSRVDCGKCHVKAYILPLVRYGAGGGVLLSVLSLHRLPQRCAEIWIYISLCFYRLCMTWISVYGIEQAAKTSTVYKSITVSHVLLTIRSSWNQRVQREREKQRGGMKPLRNTRPDKNANICEGNLYKL